VEGDRAQRARLRHGTVPLGFLSDDKTLMVASNADGRDTMAIFRFDPETRKLGEVLAQHPRFDVGTDVDGNRAGGVVTEPETDRVLGFTVNAERPQTVWIDEKEARTQATIDKALPNMRNSFRRFPELVARARSLRIRT
jgi:hypothetical protein